MQPLSSQERELSPIELRKRRRKIVVVLGFRRSDFELWLRKWKTFCYWAEERTSINKLHFPLYLVKAHEAGIKRPTQIGRKRNQFQLGRIGDKGGYTKANCRFITVQQNQEERKLNGGTAIAVEKAARIRRGQTKETDEHIASMAEKLRGRSMQDHEYLAAAGRKRGRAFKVKSPSGKRITGQSLNALCKEYGLNQSMMSKLCRGDIETYKGWTGRYTEPLKPWYRIKEKGCKKAAT